MMSKYFWKRKIIYKEYSDSDLNASYTRLGNPVKEGEIILNSLRLARYIVDSMITRQKCFSLANIEILSWILQLGIMTCEDEDGYLKLTPEIKNGIFRDFSNTARCGELAQGINLYLAKEVLGALSICDYTTYLVDHNIVVSGQTPDYVLIYDNKIGIMESKGDYQNDYPTQVLRKAKKTQCKAGKDLFNKNGLICNNGYASVVKFISKDCKDTIQNKPRDISIHYGDPQYDMKDKRIDIHEIRKEYSKWFDIMGREKDARKLKINSPIEFEYNRYNIQDGFVPINRLSYENDEISFDLEMGISSELATLLTQKDVRAEAFIDLKMKNKDSIQSFNVLDDNIFIDINIDGTYIKVMMHDNISR